ncbi:beta-propeller fold lactonase family protein [Streptomyces sp. DASNCL29]|uniref:beta-propeller fold lactonase family protein n=1 Tax=Streptomyces sp. DASNCL29 TaxID=2583819 RepID=UPI00110F85A0|nr:beta-propeller fold lactonase family protein [Streptomyces sp. DASNCL29]TMV00053.1 hypothetical protein FGK60_21890 [Streptomyces sp. DASNCL29]
MVNASTAPIPLDLKPNDVAMSPDGRRLYITSPDSTGFILVLDTQSHTVTGRIACPGATELVITPDGRRLYVTNPDNDTVSVIDTGTHTVTRTISIGATPGKLAVRPDGARVYVAADPGGVTLEDTEPGFVAVIDTASEDVIRTIPVKDPYAVAVAPDAERVYLADSRARTVHVIDGRTDTVIGTPIDVPQMSSEPAMAVSQDSRRVFVGAELGGRFCVIDAATRTVTLKGVADFIRPQDILVSGNGSRLYTSSRNAIYVFDAESLKVIRNIPLAGAPGAMALTPDGHRAYATDFLEQRVLPFETRTFSMPVGKRPEVVTLSPDGRQLYVTNSGENTVSVVQPGVARIPAVGEMRGLCVTRDGLQAYTVEDKFQDVVVFDLPAGKMLRTIDVASALTPPAVSLDSRHVYVAGSNMLSMIDTTTHDVTATATEVARMSHAHWVAVSPDNTRVYVADWLGDLTVTAFDARTLDVIGQQKLMPPENIMRVVAAMDGRVYLKRVFSLVEIDPINLEVKKTIPLTEELVDDWIAASPDGRRLYMSNRWDAFAVIDTDTFTVTEVPFRVPGFPESAVVSPDGRRLYLSAPFTQAVHVYDTATLAPLDVIPAECSSYYIALSPDGRFAYLPSSFKKSVAVVDTRTMRIPIKGEPRGIAVAPDGRRVYVVNSSAGTVAVIDTTTLKVSGTPIPVGSQPRAAALTPDGKRLYVTNSASDIVTVIDTTTLTVTGTPIPVGSVPSGVAVALDGTRAYVANSNAGTISVIDTGTNTVVGDPVGAGVAPLDVAVTPDGARLFLADAGAPEILVLDTATLTVTGSVALPSAPHALAVTRDGLTLLATLPTASSLAVVDTATLTVTGTPIPVGGSPHGVSIDADGRNAYVTNAASNTVSVIDMLHSG